MFNKHSISYTEDKRSFYFAVGVIGLSLVSYTEHKEVNSVLVSQTYEQVDKQNSESQAELTQHAMNLAQASLAADWEDEDDNHWNSFL